MQLGHYRPGVVLPLPLQLQLTPAGVRAAALYEEERWRPYPRLKQKRDAALLEMFGAVIELDKYTAVFELRPDLREKVEFLGETSQKMVTLYFTALFEGEVDAGAEPDRLPSGRGRGFRMCAGVEQENISDALEGLSAVEVARVRRLAQLGRWCGPHQFRDANGLITFRQYLGGVWTSGRGSRDADGALFDPPIDICPLSLECFNRPDPELNNSSIVGAALDALLGATKGSMSWKDLQPIRQKLVLMAEMRGSSEEGAPRPVHASNQEPEIPTPTTYTDTQMDELLKALAGLLLELCPTKAHGRGSGRSREAQLRKKLLADAK